MRHIETSMNIVTGTMQDVAAVMWAIEYSLCSVSSSLWDFIASVWAVAVFK